MSEKIRCVVMRGGTSRGLFFHLSDLPKDKGAWPSIFYKALGTPDPKQIDGLGGGTSSSSKIAIINKSSRPGIDVDYTFIQVGVGQGVIDMGGNCGNISSAVGPFAVDEGLVQAVEPYTVVNIYNTNTAKEIRAKVKVKDGKFDSEGDCVIPGLVQKGSEIVMEFFDPEGATTGKLFPTGHFTDVLQVNGNSYKVTIVDCTNPYIFVMAEEIGISGVGQSKHIDLAKQPGILQEIRDLAGRTIGLIGPAFPKICMVSHAHAYLTVNGEQVEAGDVDIVARTVSMGIPHKTIPLTGAFSLAASMVIPGTVPTSLVDHELFLNSNKSEIRIGHPEGVIKIGIEKQLDDNGGVKIVKVCAVRTARRIMEGYILL